MKQAHRYHLLLGLAVVFLHQTKAAVNIAIEGPVCLGQPTITIHLTVNNSQALVLDTAGPITPTYPLRLYYWQLSVGYNVSFSLQGLHRMYSCNMTVTYLQPMPARGVIGATLQCDMDGSLNGSTFTCSSDDESANVTLLILLCQSPYYPHPNGTSSVNGTSSAQDIMYTLAQDTTSASMVIMILVAIVVGICMAVVLIALVLVIKASTRRWVWAPSRQMLNQLWYCDEKATHNEVPESESEAGDNHRAQSTSRHSRQTAGPQRHRDDGEMGLRPADLPPNKEAVVVMAGCSGGCLLCGDLAGRCSGDQSSSMVVCTKVLTQQPSHDHEVIPMPPPQRSELEGTTTVYTSYVMIRQYMCCTK